MHILIKINIFERVYFQYNSNQNLQDMYPTKEGQIVRFHTPLEGENPDQQYVVKEIYLDIERPKAQIEALNTGLAFAPIMTVFVEDLEEIAVSTDDLIGHTVTVRKSDYSEITGKVIRALEQKLKVDLSKGVNGIETNVLLTILDGNGNEQTGTLVVR